MRLKLLLFLLLPSLYAVAQQPSRAELERQRKSILESIKQAESQLASTQKTTKATMGQLRAIQSKLNARQKLINNINQEIGQIGTSINRSTKEIDKLKGNLDILKARYAQSVRYAYKSRSSYDMLAFLFSADDFNEAVRRLRYLKRYRDYRKDQAEQIRITQSKLQKEVKSLNTERAKKDVLLVAETEQKASIEAEKAETDKIVKELKGQEKELVARIRKNRRTAEKIDKAVEEIIRKEIELARKKAEEERKKREAEERKRREEEERQKALAAAKEKEARDMGPDNYSAPKTEDRSKSNIVVTTEKPVEPPKPKPVDRYKYELTPEATALSNSFESNKGKLPWPVEKGFISLGFGTYKHPIADKVTLDNNGVDIRTSQNATVRTIFEGSVSKVFTIDGSRWNVLVNHGHYYTLYSNLARVTVQNGQKVSTKQNIGIVDMNEDGESVVNLQIWYGKTKVDPALWIAR